MPPRMGVNPEKTFRIRETAHFSDVDIESLIAHEIKGHVQKKWNAYQTGLFYLYLVRLVKIFLMKAWQFGIHLI